MRASPIKRPENVSDRSCVSLPNEPVMIRGGVRRVFVKTSREYIRNCGWIVYSAVGSSKDMQISKAHHQLRRTNAKSFQERTYGRYTVKQDECHSFVQSFRHAGWQNANVTKYKSEEKLPPKTSRPDVPQMPCSLSHKNPNTRQYGRTSAIKSKSLPLRFRPRKQNHLTMPIDLTP